MQGRIQVEYRLYYMTYNIDEILHLSPILIGNCNHSRVLKVDVLVPD